MVECIPANQNAQFEFKIQSKLLEEYEEKVRIAQAKNPPDRSIKYLKDISILKYPNSQEGFLSEINKSTISLLQWEIKRLKDRSFPSDLYKEQLQEILSTTTKCVKGEAVLRVGGHVGWNFMTGRWMIYDEDVISNEKLDIMQEASQRTDRYLGLMFPKTRKASEQGLPLGFVKISLKGN